MTKAIVSPYPHPELILREDDLLLSAVQKVYEKQGIHNDVPQNQMKGPAFQTELATVYPERQLVVNSAEFVTYNQIDRCAVLP